MSYSIADRKLELHALVDEFKQFIDDETLTIIKELDQSEEMTYNEQILHHFELCSSMFTSQKSFQIRSHPLASSPTDPLSSQPHASSAQVSR
jgi:hypothetical protein